MVKLFTLIQLYLFSSLAVAADTSDYLVQVTPEKKTMMMLQLQSGGSEVEDLKFNNWVRVKPQPGFSTQSFRALSQQEGVLHVQPNYKIQLLDNPQIAQARAANENCPLPEEYKALCDILGIGDGGGGDGGGGLPIPGDPGDGGGGNPFPGDPGGGSGSDNPAIPDKINSGSGPDPLFNKQWGMNDIGVKDSWAVEKGNPNVVVAVIDTGVDYTHEDLVENLWRNEDEIPGNNIDDDNNGYVDDVIGWDFVSNDNKPYDLKGNLFNGGNPGHGTHCAGNVAARGENGKGIAGVAPNVSIMVLRFISDKGQGTSADAIKSIKYAVDNGAQITSNSWGSVGEDPNDAAGNQALRDIITYAKNKGSLFVAAAGNGKQGIGYDNDTDSQPAYPASYPHDNIISVAAIDVNDNLGGFSNWGRKTVDIGAPGVKVFSTVVGNGYEDSLLGGLASWDGTSMATPHVAGAAALYWSKHPTADWQEVKTAILSSVAKTSTLSSKTVSGGKLDVKALMNQ